MSHSHDKEHVHFHGLSSPDHKHSHQPHQSARNILIAFLLNLGFSIYEFIGGIFTGSTAIMSDSVHDFGDALSIGISFFLEKKSEKHPDSHYTYGYVRYSLVGGMITTLILLLGSIFVIVNAILRLFNPIEINYDGMIRHYAFHRHYLSRSDPFHLCRLFHLLARHSKLPFHS